ncbi:MAG: hypothetical protein M1415_02855 [Firmicutes bacterium]|nr:hypothetical protein [Bacillota bacterium]MCL5064249.1 hypothetical protein [Bacillota bacterium]
MTRPPPAASLAMDAAADWLTGWGRGNAGDISAVVVVRASQAANPVMNVHLVANMRP